MTAARQYLLVMAIRMLFALAIVALRAEWIFAKFAVADNVTMLVPGFRPPAVPLVVVNPYLRSGHEWVVRIQYIYIYIYTTLSLFF